jgi:hypothetical protein
LASLRRWKLANSGQELLGKTIEAPPPVRETRWSYSPFHDICFWIVEALVEVISGGGPPRRLSLAPYQSNSSKDNFQQNKTMA